MQRVPEPQEAAGGGGVFVPGRGGATTPGSGSVQAADGSTITWTTAANGTITAIGAAGRQMVIDPTQQGAGVFTVRVAFSVAGQGIYLTIDRSINETNRVASVGIAGRGSQVTLAITLSGANTGLALHPAPSARRRSAGAARSTLRLTRRRRWLAPRASTATLSTRSSPRLHISLRHSGFSPGFLPGGPSPLRQLGTSWCGKNRSASSSARRRSGGSRRWQLPHSPSGPAGWTSSSGRVSF